MFRVPLFESPCGLPRRPVGHGSRALQEVTLTKVRRLAVTREWQTLKRKKKKTRSSRAQKNGKQKTCNGAAAANGVQIKITKQRPKSFGEALRLVS